MDGDIQKIRCKSFFQKYKFTNFLISKGESDSSVNPVQSVFRKATPKLSKSLVIPKVIDLSKGHSLGESS